MKRFAVALCALMMVAGAAAQETPAVPAATQQQETQQQEPEHHGTVLMERDSSNAPKESGPVEAPLAAPTVELSDAGREMPVVTAYDLDVHLRPATAEMTVHARLRVRNSGAEPMTVLPLQLSSTLRWDAIAVEGDGGLTQAKFVRQTLDSDVDHTGRVAEAVVSLATPLAAGAEVALDVLYSGKLAASAERLERIGAPEDDAMASDWDGMEHTTASLRGFGNVVWYPAASAPALLGDGAKLFTAIGRMKLREAEATTRLRLTVEYVGEPPDAAYFCGRRNPLRPISENADVPVAESPGVATAEWAERPLGFRALSLFVVDHAPQTADDGLITAITGNDAAVAQYAAAAKLAQPLLADWFGAAQDTVTLIDHAGQPFEDGTMLVTAMQQASATALAPQMAHVLAHAWFRSREEWLDEGMAEFADLLWQEHMQSREAALETMAERTAAIALGEPAEGSGTEGQNLVNASSEVVYRSKAAAVLWMLRGLVGDDAMKKALRDYRARTALDREPTGLEQAMEQASGKDLKWFFDDWVYHDRGLPDLTIVSVTPNQLSQKAGENPNWLVAVDVQNKGDVSAAVPVTVRSLKGSTTQLLQVNAHASAVVRILFSDRPEEVTVNDGSVPEMVTSRHVRQLVSR